MAGKTGSVTLSIGDILGNKDIGNSVTPIFYTGEHLNFQSCSLKTITFNNKGAVTGGGEASGIAYNGSATKIVSYNTVGAASASHTHTKSPVQKSIGTYTASPVAPSTDSIYTLPNPFLNAITNDMVGGFIVIGSVYGIVISKTQIYVLKGSTITPGHNGTVYYYTFS